MIRILALDPASTCGWAYYDTASTPSSIECGSIKIDGKGAFEKERAIRRLFPPLIKKYQPDFVVFEAPLSHIPQFEKKGKADMFGNETTVNTINAGTILMLNRMAGAIHLVIEGFRIPCEEVRPMTWQTIIPKNFKGDTKHRVSQYCDMLGIIGKNMDARDAAIIAIWAAGRSQELKLSKLVGSAA